MSDEISHIEQQIVELLHQMSKCKDNLGMIVLEDILLHKQKRLRAMQMELKRRHDAKIEHALHDLVDKQDEEEEAYQRLLEENRKEHIIKKKKLEHDRRWNIRADPKYASEIEKDFSNNKLMERMNGELDFRIHGADKDVVSRPYMQDDGGENNYASIKRFKKHSIPSNNFSSKRMLGNRHGI